MQTEAEPPGDLLLEGSLSGGKAWLGELRDRVGGGSAAAVLPRDPASVVDRVLPLPAPLAQRIPAGGEVHAVALGTWEDPSFVVSVTIDAAGTPQQPLGPDIEVRNDGPAGARSLVAGGGSMAIADGVLFVARNDDVLERALPYMAHRMDGRTPPPGLRVRVHDDKLATRLRDRIDATVSEWTADARRAARAARARRDEPPTYGEPEEVIAIVASMIERWTGWLPDVGATELRLRTTRAGLSLSLGGEVEPGSPLSRRLDGAGTGEASALAPLPAHTALGWARFVGEGESDGVTETLARVAGDRLGEADRETLATLESRLRGALGPGTLVALGASERGAWTLLAAPTPDGASSLDPAPVRAAAEAPWIAKVGGAVLGCGAALDPAPWAERPLARGGTSYTAALCAGGTASEPRPAVAIASAPHGTALAITRVQQDASVAPGVVARLAPGPGASGGLADAPDVARALDAIEEPVLWAAVVVPSRLLPAAALLDLEPLRRAAERAPAPSSTPPIVVALARTERGLGLRIVAAPGGAEAAVEALSPWLR